MSVLLFMLIATAVLYCFFLLIREYNELLFTSYRFRYFALRDELAMLVMRGRIDEDSWEYRQIVSAINFHISAVETLSMIRLVSMLIAYHTSPEEKRQFAVLARRIEDDELKAIMVRYMDTTRDLLMRNSRCQIAIIRIAKRLLGPDARQGRHEIVENPNEALNEIEQNKTELLAGGRAGLDCPAVA